MKILMMDRDTLGSDISLEKIENCGEFISYPTTSEKDVPDRIKDAEILIVNKIKITKDVLKYAEKLKLICVTATGYDNIDVDACKERNIAVCNIIGYSTNSVAQVTLAMVLSLSVNLPCYMDFVNNGSYTKSGVANRLSPVYYELSGKTWGILGYGNIGMQVGKVASALGCNVVVNKRTACEGVNCVDIKTLCKVSDVITIHAPLTEETKKIINSETISMMKRDVIIVNTARGGVTDEEAICEALENGKIGAFGTDVYTTEPFPEDHPFNRIKHMKNVCLTPHMAWGAYEARNRCVEEVSKNISAFLSGEIRNRIDLKI